jgi:hypothetical protein
MGFFSNLFGGGKAKEPKAAPVKAAPAKAEAAPAAAKVEAKASAKTATKAEVIAPPVSSTGASQVKLRLKLAAASRAGDIESAYYAAKSLADIQAKAGRRVGERIWREEAERIITSM